MSKQPPFLRTVCDCSQCVKPCLHMPGALIPGDLERIAQFLNVEEHEFEWFVGYHFDASEGALVANIVDGKMVPFRIPALVPKLTERGCIFLTDDNKCSIHGASPFGCAYFDMHMKRGDESDRRMKWGLAQQMEAHIDGNNTYTNAVKHLMNIGQVTTPLAARRENLEQAEKQP